MATSALVESEDELAFPTLNISYTSASSIPLALPPYIAKGLGWPKWFGFEGVNGRLAKWLLTILSRSNESHKNVTGWVFMDFYDEPTDSSLPLLMIELNYRQLGVSKSNR